MKLYYGGLVISETNPKKDNFLFNCTRNRACQKPFFVPIGAFDNTIQFYADLPFGVPDTYNINLYDDCGAFITTVISTKYVVGQKPDGSYYGVFGNLVPADDISLVKCFYLEFIFSVGANDYIFWSEQMCFDPCQDLVLLKGCYPNEPAGTDATDCNGIYYGFPIGVGCIGTCNYRYFHWAWVRFGTVTEQKNKLTFTIFNSRKAYKNLFEREHIFECELVPTFYKNVLIGIFNRGNVTIGEDQWLLADSQEISIIDNDCKLWKVDILLSEICKQYFDCGEADCELPVDECCSPSNIVATTDGCCVPVITNVGEYVPGSDSSSGGSSGSSSSDGEFVPSCEDDPGIYLYMDRQTPGEELRINIENVGYVDQNGTVDWGDGSAPEAISTTFGVFILTHTYVNAGLFVAKFTFDDHTLINSFNDYFTFFDSPSSDAYNIVITPDFTANPFKWLDMGRGRWTEIPHSCMSPALDYFSFRSCDTLSGVIDTGVLPFSVKNLRIINCPNFTGITDVRDFGNVSSGWGVLYLGENALPVSAVNDILIALDSRGDSNGTVDLSAQTPAAAPTGAGAAAAANLIVKGWSVTTD